MSEITIKKLIETVPEKEVSVRGDQTRRIASVTWDYQKVTPNGLYFCVEDEEFQEAHVETTALDYWKEAAAAGAVCLVAERGKINELPRDVTLVEVAHLNRAMALITKAFYRDPLAGMKVIGITGTNGKTTTSQLIDSILIHAGHKTGVIGTIGVFSPSGIREASHLSNPMATEVFAIADRMRSEKVDCLTMEVTSHAGAFDRNYAIDFDVGVYTNLTQDHLDYHKTIESYKNCKLRHFQQLGTKEKKAYGIVNVDDISGREFLEAVDEQLRRSGKAEVLTYGIRNKDADLVAYPKQMTGGFSEFDLFLRGNHLCQVYLPMPGLFNIYNGLAAFGATFALGVSIEKIVEGLKHARRVDGRFERVDCNSEFEVYVDYAHTPDSLEKILQEIRGITRRRVITVFGCGGDRDRSKRSVMGSIAAGISDIAIVTSDNPRTEDPQAIINDVVAGFPEGSGAKLIIEPDRKQAIFAAMEMASAEDSVLIAGKGHEDYQIIGKTKYPFLDRRVVKEFFSSQRYRFSRAWIEIDRSAIERNFNLINADKPEGVKIMAVVKDDALGHGMIEMAGLAISAGCEYLATACLSEAIKLRKEYETVPILVFGERPDEEIPRCIRNDLSIQVQSVAKAERIGQLSQRQQKQTKVHFKVDTGMGRYGVRWDKAVEAFKAIAAIEGVSVEGIMTHFAQSDEAKKDYADLQWQRFREVLDQLDREKMLPPLVHACNTGGYLDLPHAHGNMVRLGTLPCGVYPSKVCRRIRIDGEELIPAMRAQTFIGFIKTLQPGDRLGYGMHFTAEKETRVGILPVGYGDGYPRLRNRGEVLVAGKRVPVIGGNGMDATMVDLTSLPDTKAGDEVVLLGDQGEESITAMMLADWAGTVTYEILSGWTQRMPRIIV